MDPAALASELARARVELADHRRAIEQELLTVRRLQASLLPRLPQADHFACAVLDRPADVVGGDTYDVHLTAEGRLRVFVADAPGHGVEAAMRTMIVRTVLDRHRTLRVSPGELLARVSNDLLAAFPGLDMRLAAGCFDVDLDADDDGASRVEYADAAMPGLLHVRGDRVTEHALGGTFLGLVADARFETRTLDLAPGDRLALCTDGLPELFDRHRARFPEATLHDALRAPAPLPQALDALSAHVDDFLQGAPQDDDLTIFAVEYRGGGRSWISRW